MASPGNNELKENCMYKTKVLYHDFHWFYFTMIAIIVPDKQNVAKVVVFRHISFLKC